MRIVIGGGGMVGGLLVRKLLANKHDVIVIDREKELCDQLYAETGVVAIHGSTTRIETLNDADVGRADVVVAATGSDADNLAFAIMSKSLGVPRILARMRNPAYENAYKLAGVNSILRVTDLMANQMVLEIEHPAVRRITTIGGGRADVFLVTVPKGSASSGRSVRDIVADPGFPDQCVFAAVYNEAEGDFASPRGDKVIEGGDELFLISPAANISKAVAFFGGDG